VVLHRHRRTKDRHDAVASELSHCAAQAFTTSADRSTSSAMISRRRSGPSAAAMSIECTTSANKTVTCLYSADGVALLRGVPHSLQNLAVALDCAPQEPQNRPVAVSPPPPSPLRSTSVSFHRCSLMSVRSPSPIRHEVLRPSHVVYFKTGFSFPGRPRSCHRLGHRHVPLEAKLCGQRAVAVPIVAIRDLITTCSRLEHS
jgi:hypothetical protein